MCLFSPLGEQHQRRPHRVPEVGAGGGHVRHLRGPRDGQHPLAGAHQTLEEASRLDHTERLPRAPVSRLSHES